jgi:hypothetical protein
MKILLIFILVNYFKFYSTQFLDSNPDYSIEHMDLVWSDSTEHLHLNKGHLSNSPSKNNSEPKLETKFFSKMTAPVTLVSEMVNPDQNNEILRGFRF